MNSYFVLIGKDQQGPFTLPELQHRFETGQLGENTLCASPGAAKWTPLKKLLAKGGEERFWGVPYYARDWTWAGWLAGLCFVIGAMSLILSAESVLWWFGAWLGLLILDRLNQLSGRLNR